MKPIGGFFELELGPQRGRLHPDALALTSGRACLSQILKISGARRVYLPSYTCDAVLEPLNQCQVEYGFYPVTTELRPGHFPELEDGELLLYVNYFGLQSDMVAELVERYAHRLIVDNTQAFFETGYAAGWSFNSARKFFGVPDGAYLYGGWDIDGEVEPNPDVSIDHLTDRLLGLQKRAYSRYLESEEHICARPLGMSEITRRILESVDYAAAAERRRFNYAAHARHLSSVNELSLPSECNPVPLCSPLLLPHSVDRRALFAQEIFVPTFWPDSTRRGLPEDPVAGQFAERLLPLPIDHRYDTADCERVIRAVLSLL